MIRFFFRPDKTVYALSAGHALSATDLDKLVWLFGGATPLDDEILEGPYVGPRKEMITPWSTNAVEITQNMQISGIERIEAFIPFRQGDDYDPMLSALYGQLDQQLFRIDRKPEPIRDITDIAAYNRQEGLALSEEEIAYLEQVSKRLGRPLTDSEVFGFSQVNSEHCRHKIFNGTFIIDGREQPLSLFQLIKKTSSENPNFLVSAYRDNVAFIEGPDIVQFAPLTQHQPDFFVARPVRSVLSLKAETHNFPTTVEPFNGAATGSGGEIRDRMAGGRASLPLAGTAVYMTSYPRSGKGRPWEQKIAARPWLYQTPLDILIKASNGASDFGNKFGQPLICGSLLTFEHKENGEITAYDKVIMLAGGIGYAKKSDSLKGEPAPGQKIVVMGGDNYRIGMGGGAVSSVDTGELSQAVELNAIQRSNPEMQKRVANAIRAMAEQDCNPIVSIHDHGAGGHLNCLSELVETTGGRIEVGKLPVGDPTLSEKEIIGNESQERMGLIIPEEGFGQLRQVAARERAPIYDVGVTTGDHKFTFVGRSGKNPIDWSLFDMFGSSPKTTIHDTTRQVAWQKVHYSSGKVEDYLRLVLQLEAVACKDWLTNKVDRSVTGKVAKQQTCGELQLPLNNVGVMALDYEGRAGVATSIGHAPQAGLIDPAAGAGLAVAEALTNLVWAPLTHGLRGVSLSANWMWPCKNPGEDARLYAAVQAVSNLACALGINIPTGKDSLSMTQKYPDGLQVKAPGTVIISTVAEVADIERVIEPVLQPEAGGQLFYIPFVRQDFRLGGSSLAQVLNTLGREVPQIEDPAYFRQVFDTLQAAIRAGEVVAGHDVAAGGLITTLLEMCFPAVNAGWQADISPLGDDPVRVLFSEQPAVVVQAAGRELAGRLEEAGISYTRLGRVHRKAEAILIHQQQRWQLPVGELRKLWYRSSHLLELHQTAKPQAMARLEQLGRQPLTYKLSRTFNGQRDAPTLPAKGAAPRAVAAIIREKGVNGDREMAYSLYLAGFRVKDVHMTDLVSGRETLEEVDMVVFVGGFSNSDVLGSAKGWAGAFRYNDKARLALEKFYARPDTLSLGVCNGCQLMMELELLYPGSAAHPMMQHNESGKFESAFLTVDIPDNRSVMLQGLSGSRLGIWVAHGEGRFAIPDPQAVHLAATYTYKSYPANPNGSDLQAAALCSADGRHLAMMPHLERAILPWQWAWLPAGSNWQVTPWLKAFVAAREWIEKRK